MHKSKPISPCWEGWKAGEGVPGESSRSRCRKPSPAVACVRAFPVRRKRSENGACPQKPRKWPLKRFRAFMRQFPIYACRRPLCLDFAALPGSNRHPGSQPGKAGEISQRRSENEHKPNASILTGKGLVLSLCVLLHLRSPQIA